MKFNPHFVNRYAELLTACPELTEAEIKRLRDYKPRLEKLQFFTRFALRPQQTHG